MRRGSKSLMDLGGGGGGTTSQGYKPRMGDSNGEGDTSRLEQLKLEAHNATTVLNKLKTASQGWGQPRGSGRGRGGTNTKCKTEKYRGGGQMRRGQGRGRGQPSGGMFISYEDPPLRHQGEYDDVPWRRQSGYQDQPGFQHGGYGGRPGYQHEGSGDQPGYQQGGYGVWPGHQHGGYGVWPGHQHGGYSDRPGYQHGGYSDRPGYQHGGYSDRPGYQPGGYNDRPRYQHGGDGDPPYHAPNRRDGQVTSVLLVQTLIEFPTFSSSLLQLMEGKSLQPSSVREVALKYSQIFSLKNEVVQLKPQIQICTAHSGQQGCKKQSSCTNLHICANYVLNWCHDKNCVLGHRWMTDHNMCVLKPFSLDRIPYPRLRCLIQSITERKEAGKLDVCRKYNDGGCDQSDCGALHVCRGFVIGLTKCPRDGCKLNHNLLSPDCCQLLKTYGLPANEAPRDIVLALLAANPDLTKDQQSTGTQHDKSSPQSDQQSDKSSPQSDQQSDKSSPQSDQQQTPKKDMKDTPEKTNNLADETQSMKKVTTDSGKRRKQEKTQHNDSSECSSSSSTESEGESEERGSESDLSSNSGESKSRKHIKNKSTTSETALRKERKASDSSSQNNAPYHVKRTVPLQQEIRRTLWSHYFLGNVEIPEICYHSVEDMCSNEGSGCQRLHATQHFHWQVCEAGRWINLRPSQVTCLERAFCDPSQDGVDLPRLDPATLDHTFRGLLILLGRVTWHADLKTMNLTDSTKTKTLPTRRLCTETVPGQVIKPATFIWYFLDKNNKWVQYGNVDTAGASHLVSSATTSDIDMHYKKNSLGSISFKNSKFTYILNFKTMMQTNRNTRVNREVRRRPEPHLQDEKTDVKDQKTSTDLPSTWEVMQPEERMRLITLAASSTEYQTVVGLLGNRVSSSNVMKVQRVQNPFLWRALQNKIKELTAIYGDAATVDVRQLFHGTNHKVVSSICSENFDWRLHGSSSGQSFGRGTYFSTNPAYSYNYCWADPLGMKYMFVARTAVGSFTRGDSGMVRPPTNPKTNLPFDSTVNNVTVPSIIVKYDKQEYYPEYILTLV